jgi:hypothetical protein
MAGFVPDSSKSIFINCPFDDDYQPLFEALVFSTVSCGFDPRSALETGNVSEPRMDRIVKAIFSSRFSIHDLSRSKGEGNENYARMNMPVELGISMAYKLMHPGKHDWLVLIPHGDEYVRYMSDLAAYDPLRHNGTADSVVTAVMSWLATRHGVELPVTPVFVKQRLPDVAARKRDIDADWGGFTPWADIVRVAVDAAR